MTQGFEPDPIPTQASVPRDLRREAIFHAMLAAADRRKARRNRTRLAGATLLTAAALAVAIASPLAARRDVPRPPRGAIATLPADPHPDNSAPTAPRGVQLLDASSLRRVVVAEPLTDRALEQQLAQQSRVGTATVHGRVLVLDNEAVADARPAVH